MKIREGGAFGECCGFEDAAQIKINIVSHQLSLAIARHSGIIASSNFALRKSQSIRRRKSEFARAFREMVLRVRWEGDRSDRRWVNSDEGVKECES